MAKKKQQPMVQPLQQYNTIAVLLIIIAVGIIAYWNSMNAPFAFDDFSNIVNNEELKKPSIFSDLNRPRYIALITLALNYQYNELNTFGYHLFNIIIHLLNGIMIYFLIRLIMKILHDQGRLTYRREIPLLTALIFLVHPIQTQAVTYIVQRMTSMAALFSLVAIFYYLKSRIAKKTRISYLFFSLFACLLAFKTKENTATLPFILIMLELLLFPREKITKARIFRLAPYFLLFIVIPLSFINLDQPLSDLLGELSKASADTEKISRSNYFYTQLNVIMTYLRLLLIPVNQAIDYYYPISRSLLEPGTIAGLSIILILLTGSVLIAKKYPLISFGILWFFIFLSIESSFIPIRDVIFEHRLYLPSIGFITAIISSLFLLEDTLKLKKFAFTICIIIIITLSIATYYRNQVWNDEIAIWEDASTKFPQNARAISNTGVALARKGTCEEAIVQLEKALTLNAKDSNTWYNLGYCFKTTGATDKAIEAYTKVLELNPKFQKASVDLAMIYIAKREIKKAYEVIVDANKLNPDHPYNKALFAHIYCARGKIDQALALFEEAAKTGLDHADIYFNFAICLLEHYKSAESRQNLFRTIQLNPKEVEAYYFIGVSYDDEKDYEKAAYYYKMFLSKATKSQFIPEARERIQQIGK